MHPSANTPPSDRNNHTFVQQNRKRSRYNIHNQKKRDIQKTKPTPKKTPKKACRKNIIIIILIKQCVGEKQKNQDMEKGVHKK